MTNLPVGRRARGPRSGAGKAMLLVLNSKIEKRSCLPFGLAIKAMKKGRRVTRAGWNGKYMWRCYGQGNPACPAEQVWNPHTRAIALANGGAAPVLRYIILETASGEILMGWLASQSGMLAEDWTILP